MNATSSHSMISFAFTQAAKHGMTSSRYNWVLITKDVKAKPVCNACKSPLIFVQPKVSKLSDIDSYPAKMFTSNHFEQFYWFDLTRLLLDMYSDEHENLDESQFVHGKFGSFELVQMNHSKVLFSDVTMRVHSLIPMKKQTKINYVYFGDYIASFPKGTLMKKARQSGSTVYKVVTHVVSLQLMKSVSTCPNDDPNDDPIAGAAVHHEEGRNEQHRARCLAQQLRGLSHRPVRSDSRRAWRSKDRVQFIRRECEGRGEDRVVEHGPIVG